MKLAVMVLLAAAAYGQAVVSDVVVYGATPGGIAAAVAAARAGRTVTLVEERGHIGGMAASGLGKSDVETRAAVGGLFGEFVGRVQAYYEGKYGAGSENAKKCRGGYYYEPSVAEGIFREMVAGEGRVRLVTGRRIAEVGRAGKRVVSLRVTEKATGRVEEYRGKVFVDGSYEGDLAAYGGARYRVGREGRKEYGEMHAGVVYQDYETRTFLAGSTGEGDGRVQAYTFRLCLTGEAANSVVMTEAPPEYDRRRYLGYFDDWKAGRLGRPREMKDGLGYYEPTFGTLVRALSLAELPNGKFDANMNPRPLGFPFAELNYGYPEGTWAERDRITEKIRNITLGLLWFLQNDAEVPAEHRALARRYHLARDEFQDNGHFPWQLYVREARRLVGLYTLSERDVTLGPEVGRTPVHGDSIAAGEFPMDSFPVRAREAGHERALEGYLLMLDGVTRPYQIPYRVMVPEGVEGLIVPVAASTTHVAYSTIRLEPTWMALGQAAGLAAAMAVSDGVEIRGVDVGRVQRALVGQGQVLTYFKDIDRNHAAFAALQYWGTKGFFEDYWAKADEGVDRETANRWLELSGRKERLGAGGRTVGKAELRTVLGAVVAGEGLLTRGEMCRALYEGAGPKPR